MFICQSVVFLNAPSILQISHSLSAQKSLFQRLSYDEDPKMPYLFILFGYSQSALQLFQVSSEAAALGLQPVSVKGQLG